ncbi:hypothetical protein [Micromonospora parva]|uniref:hypothetical protein n=1 Tax=Micromonospora parva TaxID=1464048 RepID=UPI00340203CD
MNTVESSAELHDHRHVTDEFAIYEQMLPMGWFGDRPDDHRLARQIGATMPDSWQHIVVDRQLGCGVTVTMERRGFTVYNVRGWPAGMPSYAPGWYRTAGRAAEAELPALVQRLRLVNTHMSLLHCAAMFHDNESPSVLRVRASDLYRYERSDDGVGGMWFGRGQAQRPVIGPAEAIRDNSPLGLAAVETSLDWLDAVVANDALVDFDRLNQGQDALGTHDFSTALGVLWQICESRLHKLAVQGQLKVDPRIKVSDLCKLLERHQLLATDLKRRLDVVREERNGLIHRGVEPSAQTAEECLDLATKLLKSVVPNLATRAPHHLFLL